VTVETIYTREEEPNRPDSQLAPGEGRLQKVCAAVHSIDRSVVVVILEGVELTPLLTCPAKG
jgi:hypothetical protein